MSRSAWLCLGLCAPLLGLACDAREITVFDLPMPAGASGSGGAASGSAGDAAGMQPFASGSGSGGSSGGIAGNQSAGSAGLAAGSGGLAGAGGMVGMPCTSEEECAAGWKCEKQGCQATTGVCAPQPVFCPPDPQPVCGCDGITYWNDCIRRQAGAVVDVPGECRGTACACDVGADCGVPFASCSHLILSDTCGHGMGSCWLLPPQCLPNNDSKMWKECRPPDAAGPPPGCVDTCWAIASEHPHIQLHHDDTCQ
jgi:hypothetical protein